MIRMRAWMPAQRSVTPSSTELTASHLALDAIEPKHLRALVRASIERRLPADQFRVLKVAEESERILIRQLVSGLGGAP